MAPDPRWDEAKLQSIAERDGAPPGGDGGSGWAHAACGTEILRESGAARLRRAGTAGCGLRDRSGRHRITASSEGAGGSGRQAAVQLIAHFQGVQDGLMATHNKWIGAPGSLSRVAS